MRLLYQQQSGVALITAILIVAMVSIAAVSMTSRQALDIRRTANILHSDQAYLYALSVEVFAKSILVQDQEPDVDYREELGGGGFTGDVEGGVISGNIIDLNGAFPLNRLRRNTGGNNSGGNNTGSNNTGSNNTGANNPGFNADTNGSVDLNYLEAFVRLLTALDVRAPRDAAAAVADWVDDGEIPLPGGFEDSDYLSLDKPYRTGNTELVSLSELLMMLGFQKDETGRDLDLLLPAGREAFVNVLPNNGVTPTSINVNTASAEVLMSLHPLITDTVAADIIAARTGNQSTTTTSTAGAGSGNTSSARGTYITGAPGDIANAIASTYITFPTPAKPVNPNDPSLINFVRDVSRLDLSATSEYFQVTSVGQVGDSELTVVSVLHRPAGAITGQNAQLVRTIRRGIGGY